MENNENFVNTYIETLAAELVKEQREKVLLKTQLLVAQNRIIELEKQQSESKNNFE
jgi:hypothetical protein